MRSEKEIREAKNSCGEGQTMPRAIILRDEFGVGFISKDWVLEGEPRYSIEELEKIQSRMWQDWFKETYPDEDASSFLKAVKENPEKVKKILEEKK